MKKRILVCLVLSLLLCCLFTGTAFAEPKHMHRHITFDTPLDTVPTPGTEGKFYLTSDLKAEGDIIVDKEIELCLNGHTIDMGPYSIRIAKKAALRVYDCSENTTGGIRSTEAAQEDMIINDGAFLFENGNLYANGRSILFNRDEASIGGGYITADDADLIKSIGTAIIAINAGRLEAVGSNSAFCMVYDPLDDTGVKRDFNVGIGGSCHVTAESGSEGVLIVDAPKGRFVLNGSNIRGTGCPAVVVKSGSFDTYGAAVIYSDTESAIVGTGGQINLYNSIITSDEKYGVDVSQDAQLLLSGSQEIIGGMAGVHLPEGKVFSMSDYGFYGNVILSIHTDIAPTEGNKVAISTPCDPKHAPHFISTNQGCSITYEDGVIYNTYDGSVSHFHEGRNYILPLDGTSSDLIKNNYVLNSDLSCSGFFTGSMVNICLNGHTLTLSSAIKLYPGSTLNIFDCTGEGKIVSNGTVVQDINDGDAKLVLHDGLLLSHGSSVVKLSGGDSLVVNGGKLQSEFEGSCAVDVIGNGNSVKVSGGEIIGAHTGIRMKDAQLTVSGTGNISGGVYAVDNAGFKQGVLYLEDSPIFNGATADIHMAAKMQLVPQKAFSAAESISLAVDAMEDYVTLSTSTDGSYGSYFQSLDGERKVISGLENSLVLAKTFPVNPDSAELSPGSSASFSAEYTGQSSQPEYQWYLRDLGSMSTEALEGAEQPECELTSLPSGQYELFCIVNDELGQHISDTASLTVISDSIENVSVYLAAELSYTGAPEAPAIEASAATTLGKSVSFTYSADGVNYSDTVPMIGPDAGQYTIFYIASAEGCEDVSGQLSVSIAPAAEAETAETESKGESKSGEKKLLNMDIRFVAIIALVAINLIVCTIYLITKLKKD